MTHEKSECPYCHAETIPDRNGDCPNCRRNLLPVVKDPTEELQFYCVVCDEFFFTCRDDSGLDQAPCPECGDLSNTAKFHAGEMIRTQQEKQSARWWAVYGVPLIIAVVAFRIIMRIIFG